MQTVVMIAALPGGLVGPPAGAVDEGEAKGFAEAFLTAVGEPAAMADPAPEAVPPQENLPLVLGSCEPAIWSLTAPAPQSPVEVLAPAAAPGDLLETGVAYLSGRDAQSPGPGEKETKRITSVDLPLPPVAMTPLPIPVSLPTATALPSGPVEPPAIPPRVAKPDAALPALSPAPLPLHMPQAAALAVAEQRLPDLPPAPPTSLPPLPVKAGKTPIAAADLPLTGPPFPGRPPVAIPAPELRPTAEKTPPSPVLTPERPHSAPILPVGEGKEKRVAPPPLPAAPIVAGDAPLILAGDRVAPLVALPTDSVALPTTLPTEKFSVVRPERPISEMAAGPLPRGPAVDLPQAPMVSLWQGQFVIDQPALGSTALLETPAQPAPDPMPAARMPAPRMLAPDPTPASLPPTLALPVPLPSFAALPEPSPIVAPADADPSAQAVMAPRPETAAPSIMSVTVTAAHPVIVLPSTTPQPAVEIEDLRIPDGFSPLATQLAPLSMPAPSLPVAAPVIPLATQIVDSIAQRPDGTTEFTLAPEELGRVRLTLQADAQNPDRMVVMLSFDRPETLDLFRRHADQLVETIRAAGFASVDIGFDQRGAGAGPDGQPQAKPENTLFAAATEPALAEPALTEPVHRPLASSSLDLRL